jgi:hypothetical protein
LFEIRDPQTGGSVHNVAWIGREGINPDTVEAYSYHQAVCDCLPLSEALEDVSLMFTCPHFVTGLIARAHAIRGNPELQTLLEDEPNYESAERYGINNFDDIDPRVIEAIMFLLKRDIECPEAWVGNFRSGSHELVLVSQVIERDLTETKEYAAMMEALGLIHSPNGMDIQLAA